MAAGAGAAGLTAGAAALVSTLGLDIGLTVSAAGPVGAVVGALTGLGFLFADLFGGGPDIPRELRLPAHSLLGMEQFAGIADIVNQRSKLPAPRESLGAGIIVAGELKPFKRPPSYQRRYYLGDPWSKGRGVYKLDDYRPKPFFSLPGSGYMIDVVPFVMPIEPYCNMYDRHVLPGSRPEFCGPEPPT
jgi:hypothetical protein